MIKRKQRIPLRDLSTMKPEDREAIEKNAMNGQVFNIFKVMANHPALTKRWTPFAGHILSKQTLPFRDRELLILRIGWLNQAESEFAQHELIAKRGGVTDADIANLKEGNAFRFHAFARPFFALEGHQFSTPGQAKLAAAKLQPPRESLRAE